MKSHATGARELGNVRDAFLRFFKEEAPSFDTALLIRVGKNREPAPREATRARARELAAILNFAVLLESECRHAVALVDRFPHVASRDLAFNISKQASVQLNWSWPGHAPSTALDGHALSRVDLRRIFCTPPLAELATLMLSAKRTREGGLSQAARRAALHLSEAVVSSLAESRVLGGVTAIEILIGEIGMRTDRLERRIRALVGADRYASLRGKAMFDARNAYVHDGGEASEPVAQRAIALAAEVVCKVADLVRVFRSKQQLTNYLDVVVAADSALDGCPAEHVGGLKGVRHHRRSGDTP